MKFNQLAKQVRFQCWADEYTLKDSDLTMLYNSEIDSYCNVWVLANSNEYYLGKSVELINNSNKIEIPYDIIRIRRVELYIGGEWIVGQLYNINRIPLLSEKVELQKEGYAIMGREIIVLSENVEKINIYGQYYPLYIEDDSVWQSESELGEMGLSRVWYRLLKNRMAIVWKETRDKPIALTVYEKQLAVDVQTAMRVAGILDKQRIYKIKKKRLEDVYCDEWMSVWMDNKETLLIDSEAIFLTI